MHIISINSFLTWLRFARMLSVVRGAPSKGFWAVRHEAEQWEDTMEQFCSSQLKKSRCAETNLYEWWSRCSKSPTSDQFCVIYADCAGFREKQDNGWVWKGNNKHNNKTIESPFLRFLQCIQTKVGFPGYCHVFFFECKCHSCVILA